MEDIVSDLGDRNFEHRREQRKENKVKKTYTFYGTESKEKYGIIGNLEREEKEKGTDILFKEIIENCPAWGKT